MAEHFPKQYNSRQTPGHVTEIMLSDVNLETTKHALDVLNQHVMIFMLSHKRPPHDLIHPDPLVPR